MEIAKAKRKSKLSLKVQNGQKTYAELVAIARKVFSKRGYSDTAIEEIVRKAGVTRGALYHHFEGKKGLFLAVEFNDALFVVDFVQEQPVLHAVVEPPLNDLSFQFELDDGDGFLHPGHEQ